MLSLVQELLYKIARIGLEAGLCLCLSLLAAFRAGSQDSPEVIGPVGHVYSVASGDSLNAYVFTQPTDSSDSVRSAIILFHGGGWYMGSPEWAFSRARHFAERGMVAVAAQYRLSSSKTGITPLEAMADARAAIRWLRAHAGELRISPARIAAYGWSAGAHLAACAAVFADADSAAVSCRPDALILFSAALDVASDVWMRRILGGRAKPEDISPDRHVRSSMPPTIILQGRTDTVTPLTGAQRFHDRMLAAGNDYRLHVYDGVGHLFTPSTESDRGWPNPDREIQARAFSEADRFLMELGFIKDIDQQN